jgi:2-dehydro-3-deoxygluconokinase
VTGPFDVVALGETMVSLIATDGMLEDAGAFRATVGGAETNTLIAMSRLGASTAWVSRLGDDVLGRRIEHSLRAEGVDLRWVRRDPDHPTGVMIRDTLGHVVYKRASSAASFLSPDDLVDVPFSEARAALVTGVTALIGEGPQRAAIALLEGATGLRVVDPNLRPGLWGSDRAPTLISPLVERCDLLIGGEGELTALLGGDRTGGLRALAERWQAAGPAEVVIKRGPAGAAVLDADGAWAESTGSSVHEVDPVGAGDAFNAGYLHVRLAGGSPMDALAAGTEMGAASAGSFGDIAGSSRSAVSVPGDEA